MSVDRKLLQSYVDQISRNMTDMGYTLQFTCGVSKEATEIILPQCVKKSCTWFVDKKKSPCLDCADSIQNDPLILPLLLLFESQLANLCHHLKPIFDISISNKVPMKFKLGNKLESLLALEYLLTCQYPGGSILQEIRLASIEIKNSSKRTIHICQSLLDSMPRIYRLFLTLPRYHEEIVWPGELKSEKNNRDNVYINLGNSRSLTQLSVHGGINSLTMESMFGATPPVTGLKIWDPSFEYHQMRKFLSNLKGLTTLVLIGNDEIQSHRDVVGTCLDSILQNKVRTLVLEPDKYVHVITIRPFLSTVRMLYVSNLRNKQFRELSATLFDEGKRQLHNFKKKRSKTALPCRYLRIINTSEGISTGSVRLLAKSFKYLRLSVLNLRNTKISVDGFKLIAASLHYLECLFEINMSDNEILSASQAICKSISSLLKLQKVLLRHAGLNDQGISELGRSLQHLGTVKILNLSWNRVDSFSMSALCQGIRKSKCLQELTLKNCGLTDEYIAMLPYESMAKVTHLNLCGKTLFQGYSATGAASILRSLKYLKRLKYLEIPNHLHFHRRKHQTKAFNTDDEVNFLSECYSRCLPGDKSSCATLRLERKDIRAIRDYVERLELLSILPFNNTSTDQLEL